MQRQVCTGDMVVTSCCTGHIVMTSFRGAVVTSCGSGHIVTTSFRGAIIALLFRVDANQRKLKVHTIPEKADVSYWVSDVFKRS